MQNPTYSHDKTPGGAELEEIYTIAPKGKILSRSKHDHVVERPLH